jgi:acetyl esterase
MQAVLDALAAFEAPPLAEVSARVARQAPAPADAVRALLAAQGESLAPAPVGDVSHQVIPGPDGGILARIFTPEGEGPFPIIVYYHGGGWVIAGLDAYEASMRALSNAAGAIVVGVAYRQAPEHRFPAAVEDAYTAFQWVVENADTLNGDPAWVAVAGESAGGNLAAVVSQIARDRGEPLPVHQVLVYPIAQMVSLETPSYETYAGAVPLSRPLMAWFLQRYLAETEQAFHPYASPLLAEDLSGLPGATVITADIDPLRSEGEAYALRLQEAGVPVTYQNFEGVTHEFFGMGAVLAEAEAAVDLAAGNLVGAFAAITPTVTTEVTTTAEVTPTAGAVMDVLSNTAELTEFAGFLAATGLDEELAGEGPFTIFAPTNDAFAALPPETLAAFEGDLAALTTAMQYHLVVDAVTTADLAELGAALTFTGDAVTVETTDDGALTIDGATVIQGDIAAANGVIHIIDTVLLPPTGTVVDVLSATPDLARFVGFLAATGLDEELAGEGPFTVFAPTDAAFAALPPETLAALEGDVAALTTAMQYHLVADEVTTADLAELGAALTFTGDSVTVVTTDDGALTIDGATVIQGDIAAGNGLVHIIDAVLLPPAP